MSAYGTVYPALSYISSISNALNAIVTFAEPHDFTVGEIISFRVSSAFGMVELNNQQALVLDTTTYTVTVPVNTTNYTPFISPPYQLAITTVSVDTPTVGYTQISFVSNPFTNGQLIFLQNIEGSLDLMNLQVYEVSGATSTTINIEFPSTGLIYEGGGNGTIYPFSIFTYLPVAVPSSSGVIPGSFPIQTNLEDSFDRRPPNQPLPS